MAIDTIEQWHPKLALPLYTKITDPRQNDYTVGQVYEMRILDPDRARDRDQKGPYNYVHEAMLISMTTMDLEQVPDILLGFDQLTRSRSDALDSITDNNGEIVMLIFLRLDVAKGIVTDGLETVHKTMSKEATEDDGTEGQR